MNTGRINLKKQKKNSHFENYVNNTACKLLEKNIVITVNNETTINMIWSSCANKMQAMTEIWTPNVEEL